MRRESIRFTPRSFLKDISSFIVFMVVLIAFITLVLKALSFSNTGIVVVDVFLLVCTFVYAIFKYRQHVSFWRDLENCIESLDRVGHFPDLIERPKFLEGQIAYDALCEVASLADEEFIDLKTAANENSEYITTWVHEVKTSLAAARLIAEGISSSDAALLKRELERTEVFVQQALYAARADSLAHDYLIREICLAEVVREASKANMHYLMSLNVSVEVRVDPSFTIYADKQWLNFIITQLITNSAKYEAKTISITAQKPQRETSSGCTLLEVKDDGCGIPAEDVPRVFERGFTGKVGRTHGSATGMGLYLVAQMCAQMGLGICLASEEGRGTRVEISFPHDRRKMSLTNL